MVHSIPLTQPPRILRLDRSTHGHRRRESFRIREYWVMHLYHYHATLQLRDHTLSIEPGMVTLTAPDERTVYDFPSADCEHFYAFIEPVEDTLKQSVRLVYYPTEIEKDFVSSFRLAIEAFHDRPDQSRAVIWNLLWTLANLSSPSLERTSDNKQPLAHPAVRKAQRIIQMDLRRPLKVHLIARECKISHNQLTRLFRQHVGMTVAGYIKHQRTRQAEYLLKNSSLPVKIIAQECGIPDLHYFNKVVKAHFGLPPSRMR